MESIVINTRADLDALVGTQRHADFIASLKGSMLARSNVATYPANYNHMLQPSAAGYIAPVWQDVENLSAIARFGFTKTEILAIDPG